MGSKEISDRQAPSVAEFLTAAPWKHALFTTYALSLSYFESEVLRLLLQQGCDDIWLVCDAQGYRSSLLERRSMRVGQEYRIVPVGLPQGVFHPKCVHLIGEDQQLLLVGSGNVTFGGHGRNSEVFEALTPDAHRAAFADFAEFLEALGSDPNFRIPRRDWIDDFAGRAAQAGGSEEDKSGEHLRLIHPLQRSAIDQLAEYAGSMGACSDVKIISPYHDPDGEVVRRLLDVVDAANCTVAVTSDDASPFPFSEASTWPRKVSPRKPKLQGKRFVHAKWLEFDFGEERLVLTGSFNATRKALASCDNVELGVLRRARAEDEFLHWEDCKSPRFEPTKRLPSGLGQTEIVYAAFDRHDPQKLTGQLISLQDVAGDWIYRIVQADGSTHSGEAALRDDGGFTIVDHDLEKFAELPALQIVLQKDAREARGWVHNEMLLSVGARRRLTAGALSRLMRREGSDDDIQALMDYLSVAADKHLRVFDRPVSQNAEDESSTGEVEAADTVLVRLEDLAPVAEPQLIAPSDAGFGLVGGDQFEAALVRLRRMFLGHGSARSAFSRDGLSSSILIEDDEDELKRDVPEKVAYSLGLKDFEDAIGAMIDDCADQPDRLTGLLTIQFEIGMWMRVHRLEDIDGAFEFLGSWLRRTAQIATQPQEQVTALSQHFVTATAIRSALIMEEEKSDQLVGLHDDLEKFFGEMLRQSCAEALLIEDPEKGFASALAQGKWGRPLKAALSQVLATPTRRQQLEEVLLARAEGREASPDAEVFRSPTGKLLYRALHRDGWERRIKRASSKGLACSHCRLVYPRQEQSVFERERIGRCVQCGKFSLDISP